MVRESSSLAYRVINLLRAKAASLLNSCTLGQRKKALMYPKHQYVRDKALLKRVALLNCQHCGSGTMVQAAHTNWGGGKGRGIKADDNLVAALCQTCHWEVDQGTKLSKQERQTMWQAAHEKTIKALND